jgi:uncharacterized surface protein with fasciclin (FAS1) repeats
MADQPAQPASKRAASRRTTSKKSTIGAQYETALLAAPETVTVRTTTTRPVLSRPATAPNGAAVGVAVARPATPKTVQRSAQASAAAGAAGATVAVGVGASKSAVATTCTTSVETPTNTLGVVERLTALGYEARGLFVSEGRVEAVYAVSPLGEKVLVRTRSRPKAEPSELPSVRVEAADDPLVGADVYEFFQRRLVTDASLGKRIDTDFAIATPDGISIWIDDGTLGVHWLYGGEEDFVSAADVIGVNVGWFALASVELDALHEPQPDAKTIVDRLYDPPLDDDGEPVASFSILIQLLRMSGLLEVLRSGGPFTLLAPTDEAFAALPEGVARDLVSYPSRQKLVSILEYHLYPDKELASQVGDRPTVQGELISWDKSVDPITANNANVLFTDLDASNGVVHIVDAVLMPKNPGAGALTSLLEPVDSDDVDYTTWRIRTTLREFQNNAVKDLRAARQRHEDAVAELVTAIGHTLAAAEDTLAKTQHYNRISDVKSRAGDAVKLADQISLDNDKFDINLIRLNELQFISRESDEVTARIKALAVRLRQTSSVTQ